MQSAPSYFSQSGIDLAPVKLRIFILLSFLLHGLAAIWFWRTPPDPKPVELATVVDISEIPQFPSSGHRQFARYRKPLMPSASHREIPTDKFSPAIEKPAETLDSSRDEKAPSTSEDRASEPIGVGSVTVAPKLLFRKKVPYPLSAGRAGVEGVVDLKIVIDQEGRVKEAQVVRGPGYGLDEAALAAVKDCLFSPAWLGSVKVPVRMGFQYEFQLGER